MWQTNVPDLPLDSVLLTSSGEKYQLTPLNDFEINEAFSFLKSQKMWHWDYLEDFCFNRAHLAAYELEKNFSIRTAKVFNFGFFPISKIQSHWFYHVAIVVAHLSTELEKHSQNFKTSRSIDLFVLDPSLFDQPVPLSSWFQALQDPEAYYFITKPYTYDHTHPEWLTKPKQDWSVEELELARKELAQIHTHKIKTSILNRH